MENNKNNILEESLSIDEKKNLMEDLFPKTKIYIENVGNYLADNFKKIDGFDYRWSSLITSKPLLFEDVDYVRVRDFVLNECTQEEIEAYRSGKLRKLYTSFETLIICNLEYYDRIMQFCTMVFCKYVRVNENLVVNDGLKDLPYIFSMTPTQIWCCAMTYIDSTEWELNYAWSIKKKKVIKKYPTGNKSLLEVNYKTIYGNKFFARFVEYASLRTGIPGFIHCFQNDKTINKKLGQVCSKFTKASAAIDEEQLQTLSDYIFEDEKISNKLYYKLDDTLMRVYKGNRKEFSIYIFQDNFFICAVDFTLKVTKSSDGKITKEYLGNAYKCLLSESFLSDTIEAQLEWSRAKIDDKFDFDREILKNILQQMLLQDYHEIKCLKQFSDNIYSEITFGKIYRNYTAYEKFYKKVGDNSILVHKIDDKTLGLQNMVNYIINHGYYIFGTKHDIDVLFIKDVTKQNLINHYSNYCIPIMNHMKDVIQLNKTYNNEIIDFLLTGEINPAKLNNKNIRFTKVNGNHLTSKEIMKQIKLLNNGIKESKGKRNIWQVYNS